MYRYSRTALCAPLAYACASTLVNTSGRELPYLSSKLLSAPGRTRSTASAGWSYDQSCKFIGWLADGVVSALRLGELPSGVQLPEPFAKFGCPVIAERTASLRFRLRR